MSNNTPVTDSLPTYEAPKNPKKQGSWSNTLSFKIVSIGVLIVVLLIPASMIELLVQDREQYRNTAIREISSKWGDAQTVGGPILTVPYLVHTVSTSTINGVQKDEIIVKTKYAHFLPADLEIKGVINPELRYRGIYEAVLYNTQLAIKGHFDFPTFDLWNIEAKNIVWDKAVLSVGIPDMSGINENIALQWNDISGLLFEPGIDNRDVFESGVSVKVPISTEDKKPDKYTFSFTLDINGSHRLSFIPVGKETQIDLSSAWASPSFNGAFLPDNRTVTEEGFTSNWKVLHLNRNYPQQWKGKAHEIISSKFGVQLLVPIDEYQKNTRSAKYAIMFIVLTFVGFFFVEILNKMQIHPLQYLLVGIALCVFYLLLLSLSEHSSFNKAYMIASLATIVLITAYCRSVFKSNQLSLIMCGTLVGLYLFLYFVLQLQDYALLMGSLGVFIILALVMYLSRNIDWYKVGGIK